MFKDSPEGTTHYYGDGCEEEHGKRKICKIKDCDSTVNQTLGDGSLCIIHFMKKAKEDNCLSRKNYGE